jgi:hypothetical protein
MYFANCYVDMSHVDYQIFHFGKHFLSLYMLDLDFYYMRK